MGQPPFQFIAGSLALDFTNTVGDRLAEGMPRDYFRSMADVIDWGEAAGVEPFLALGRGARTARVRESDLTRVRTVRERLYRIFTARVEGRTPVATDLEALNASIHQARRRQHIARTAHGFTWEWDASVAPLDRALGLIALDAATLLTSPRQAHIRRCHDNRCGWLFVDESRGGRRRWCSMADCGNRNKARRHYERQRR